VSCRYIVHQSLPLFSQYVYQLLTDNKQLTAAAKKQADNLIRHDVFDKYQHWRTVDMALTNIGKRIRGTNPLHEAAGEMLQHYPALERQFLDFYPQLQNYVWQIRQEFNSDSKT
jgi:acyl carrier protein phosphodiesterase